MEKKDILVSIWCLTYNHELYIRDAIEGFLAQNVNFEYEIIIHDDASTDNTAKVVEEYERKYPEVIHGIYQKRNQYSKNYPSTKWMIEMMIQNCKGKYIAMCEGDDYWIDVQKLQIQINYLERHSECMMTIHNGVIINYENDKIYSANLYTDDCMMPPKDIITQKIIPLTASMVYRREAKEMEEFFSNAGIGDYPNLLYCLTKGELYYFNRVMSVYRFRHSDSWTSNILQSKHSLIIHNVAMINFLEEFNRYTNREYEEYIVCRIQKSVTNILAFCEDMGNKKFIEICKECNKKTDKKYSIIFNQLKIMYLQVFNKEYLGKQTREFIKKNNRIVIMGIGKYAKIISDQFNFNNIRFEGYVVSNNQHTVERFLDRNVWKIKDIPKSTGIIIGINPIIWDEIILSLEEEKLCNYICPFLLK